MTAESDGAAGRAGGAFDAGQFEMGRLERLKRALQAALPPWAFRRALAARRSWAGLVARVAMAADYVYDARRYARWSHGGALAQTRAQLEAALIKQMHGIEKGLALAAPRPGFGQPKARALAERVDEWRAAHGFGGMALSAAAILREYRDFNARAGVPLPWLDAWLDSLETPAPAPPPGGTIALTREAVAADVARGGDAFFASRHSIRQFADAEVPMADVERAVAMAQKTPSVCNRQGPRVYCFENAMDALRWQPGNAGFGHLASRALVVTADLQAFHGPGERNQCWIDGGMFAMSLVYALHALGYGTCTLAWSMRAGPDRRMRAALGIPDSEAVIMMIAVGVLPESFSVALSLRRPLSDVLVTR